MKYGPYSHSRLGTFETCPRQFAYAYIEKPEIEEGPDSIESVLGTAVHDSLEALYRARQMERALSLDEVLADFQKRWQKRGGPGAAVRDGRFTPDDYRKVGKVCLEKYYLRHHPFNHGQVIGIEEKILLDLGGGIRLRGFIDRLDRVADGEYEIHDYKTSKYLPLQVDVDEQRQLALYQLAVQERFPDAKQVTLVWHYLRFDAMLRSNRTTESLSALKRGIVELVGQIESSTSFPTRISNLCDWCNYKEICPAWAHPSKVEALPAREFKKDDGVRLVDRLTRLHEKKAEARAAVGSIEEKEGELKDEIVAYAAQYGFEQVAGSTKLAKVTEKESWSFPGANDEDQPRLIELCRKLGLWKEVTGFDRRAFERMLKAKPELAKSFKGLVNLARRTEVRLSKRNPGEED
jgi:putative RecB family exonuclease